MSYRNNDYYVDHFKKITPDEAYALVVLNMKRPGYAFEFDCAKKAFAVVYPGVDFISPDERHHRELIAKNAELEAKIAEKQAVIKDEIKEEKHEEKEEGNGLLTKAEFKVKFCKDLGYGSQVVLSTAENMKFGRAWKKYPHKAE